MSRTHRTCEINGVIIHGERLLPERAYRLAEISVYELARWLMPYINSGARTEKAEGKPNDLSPAA